LKINLDNYTLLGIQLTFIDQSNMTIPFSIDNSIPESLAWNRFKLLFEQETFSTTDEELDLEIKLFPNPAKDFVIISFGDFSLSDVRITLSDIQGRQIRTIEKENMTSDEIRVNKSDLSQGIYLVKINSGQFQYTAKMVVE